jgi:hypothetical protein
MKSMPSFDVAVTIKTAYHRDPSHRWTTNDIADIDALGSTLPYCDVVMTDKAVASNVKRAKLTERLDTVVLSRLSDLVTVTFKRAANALADDRDRATSVLMAATPQF